MRWARLIPQKTWLVANPGATYWLGPRLAAVRVWSHRSIRVFHEFAGTAILLLLGFAAFRTFAFFLAGGGL